MAGRIGFARRVEKTLKLACEHIVVTATAIGAEADGRVAVGCAAEGEASRLRVAPGKGITEGDRSGEGERRKRPTPKPCVLHCLIFSSEVVDAAY